MSFVRNVYDADNDKILGWGRDAIAAEVRGLRELADNLDDSFARAVSLIASCEGMIIVAGMGKSGHVGRKIAATLSSTGTRAVFVHPAEASHGDLGVVSPNDICIAISNSGETPELADILRHCSSNSIPVIAITRKPSSTVAGQALVILKLPGAPEACPIGRAPTTSTTCTLALGDALAVTVMKMKKFGQDQFLSFHPGGSLGGRLLPVHRIMHVNERLPTVSAEADMRDVMLMMSRSGLGVALISDEHSRLLGIITDGDLRRHYAVLFESVASQIGTMNPKCIGPDVIIDDAVQLMNSKGVSALPIVDDDGKLLGLVTIHDCLAINK